MRLAAICIVATLAVGCAPAESVADAGAIAVEAARVTTSYGWPLGVRDAGTPILPALSGARTYMPIGNSLTRGASSEAGAALAYLGGYRTGIDARVQSYGLPWTPVGPASDNGLAHAAINGRDTAGLLTNLPGLIAGYDPDVVILYEGTVDCLSDTYNGATSAANLATALDDIEAGWPSARVIVITPIPTLTGQYAAKAANVTDYNSRVPAVLDASAQHLDGRMIRVDAAALITASHVSAGDGAHYPQSSHDALASLIWPALVNAMGADARW